MTERSKVQRASTYRVRERDPLCGWCGEPIREWHGSHEEQDESWGNISLPVHDACSSDPNDEAPPGWFVVG